VLWFFEKMVEYWRYIADGGTQEDAAGPRRRRIMIGIYDSAERGLLEYERRSGGVRVSSMGWGFAVSCAWVIGAVATIGIGPV